LHAPATREIFLPSLHDALPILGLNLPLGPLMATVGGKGVYTNPNYGDEGYAAAVGGGLQWKIGNSFRLFGEYYYSPDSLSSGIQDRKSTRLNSSHVSI